MRLLALLALLLFSQMATAHPLDQAAANVAALFTDEKDKELAQDFVAKKKYQELAWLGVGKIDKEVVDRLLEYLQTYMAEALIIDIASLDGGKTNISKIVTFENGTRAVFKRRLDMSNIFSNAYYSTNIYSEVGVYRIDQLLGFYLVPVTILRDVKAGVFSYTGSLQYFVEGAETAEKFFGKNQPAKPIEMQALDAITKNADRHAENYMYHPILKRFIAIDNSWALRSSCDFVDSIGICCIDKRSKNEKEMRFPGQLDPQIYRKLQGLHMTEIALALDGLCNLLMVSEVMLRCGWLLERLSAPLGE